MSRTRATLLHSLQDADDESYAQVCEALRRFDVRDRLAEVDGRVLAVAGSDDVATPPELLEEIAAGIAACRLVVLDGVGPPARRPRCRPSSSSCWRSIWSRARTRPSAYPPRRATMPRTLCTTRAWRSAGRCSAMRTSTGRPAVDHDLTREFQELITRYAWGSIWTRPGLDRRSRSMITLTALIARGHHEELAMHLRAARTNGLTDDEIEEVLLQSAIYCGVPDANTAFRDGANRSHGTRSDRGAVLMTHATGESAYVYAAVRTPFGRYGGAWPASGPTTSPPRRCAASWTRSPASTRSDIDDVVLGQRQRRR